MIGKQVYRRGELRVDFPQLEKVSVTQSVSEFKTARKYYGNLKNEGSPEFKVGTFAYQVDAINRSKASFESEKSGSTRPSQNNPEVDSHKPELDPTEALEVELLKEELRRRDEEIRRLLQYDRSLTPIAPARQDPARSLTPLELYQKSMPQQPAQHEKPKSVSPFRGDQRGPSILAANGSFVAHKDPLELPSVHELAKLPHFQQPKYTTKHPKVHLDNPITDRGPAPPGGLRQHADVPVQERHQSQTAVAIIVAVMDVAENWQLQYTEDGRICYLNSKEKSWVKPDALKTDEERLNNTGWEEMTTESGKTYYTNRKTGEVLWRMPAELQEFKNKEAARNLEAKLLKDDASVCSMQDMEEQEEGQVTDETGAKEERVKEEVRNTYIQMFEEVGVTSTWKWEDFSRIVRDDERYILIKTISQKKLIFNDHIQTLRRKEREEARVKKQIARDNFMKMLDASTMLKPESKFYRTAHFFQGDPRWRILDEKERVELFQDYLDELEKRDKEKRKQTRKQQMETLRKLLGEREGITYTTRWYNVCKLLADNPAFTALDKLDQLTVFRDWVVDTEKRVEEAKKMEKRTNERKARESFRALLQEKMKSGELTVCTHWRPFVHSIQDHPAYLGLVGQAGSTPKELFDDAIEALKEQNQNVKELVEKRWAEAKFEVQNETTLEDAMGKAAKEELPEGVGRKQVEDVCKWLLEDGLVDLRDRQRKKKKHEKLFDDFLHTLPLSSQSTLQDFPQELGEARLKFKRLLDTELQQLFTSYVEKIRVMPTQEDEKSMEIEPGEIKKKAHHSKDHKERRSKHKHHKKHKHHSSRSPPSVQPSSQSHKRHKRHHSSQKSPPSPH